MSCPVPVEVGGEPAGSAGLAGMLDGVPNDMCHVVVGQGVPGLPAVAISSHQPRPAQDGQVLGHQRLGYVEFVDEFVDGAVTLWDIQQIGFLLSDAAGEVSLGSLSVADAGSVGLFIADHYTSGGLVNRSAPRGRPFARHIFIRHRQRIHAGTIRILDRGQ